MAIAASPEPREVPYETQSPERGLFQRIWARIPRTTAFEQRKASIIFDDSRTLLGKLREIVPVVPDESPRIRFTDVALMTLFITNAARLRFWRKELDYWLTWIQVAGGLGATLACTVTAKKVWHIHQAPIGWLWAILASCVVLGACVFCFYIGGTLLFDFLDESLPEPAKIVGLLTPFGLALLSCLIVVHRLRVVSPRSTLTFAASVGVFQLRNL